MQHFISKECCRGLFIGKRFKKEWFRENSLRKTNKGWGKKNSGVILKIDPDQESN